MQAVCDQSAFTLALQQAVREADSGTIAILGIAPDRPETGYGFFKTAASQTHVLEVERFIEKPNAETAQRYHFDDVLTTDSCNRLVHSTSRFVSLVGVENLVVIETLDAVLVADRYRSQDVKAIVNQLQSAGREEYVLHRNVPRPWGWYDSIESGSYLGEDDIVRFEDNYGRGNQ